MGVQGKKLRSWKDLSAQRQITQYVLELCVLEGTGKKGGARSVSRRRVEHEGITEERWGGKETRRLFPRPLVVV